MGYDRVCRIPSSSLGSNTIGAAATVPQTPVCKLFDTSDSSHWHEDIDREMQEQQKRVLPVFFVSKPDSCRTEEEFIHIEIPCLLFQQAPHCTAKRILIH